MTLRLGIGSVILTPTPKRSTRTRWTARRPLLWDTGKHVWTSGCRCRTSWRSQNQYSVALLRRASGGSSLAAADQQGAGRDVYVPPLQGHGLADTQPGSPHDERRHPGAAKPQGRQGVQEPLDLLGFQ